MVFLFVFDSSMKNVMLVVLIVAVMCTVMAVEDPEKEMDQFLQKRDVYGSCKDLY